MFLTIDDVRKAVLSGTSVLDIAHYYLKNINANKHLNAFVEVFEEEVLEEAKRIDKKIQEGTAKSLAGVVIGIKDNICLKTHKVSASSKILENFTSLYTATALQRLMDEDAIVIGRLNCDEFAMGGSNETSYFGPVQNNYKENYVPGGSSGGSAVAVSANLCTISLGSDTGGSIRQPASWTNTFGMKPTYGRISRYGLIAYASSFDQIGCFSNDLPGCELITKVMSGKDPADSTSSSNTWEDGVSKGLQKIAVFKEHYTNEYIDSEVRDRFMEKLENLKSKGIEIQEYDFPYLDVLVPCYYILTTAEASSNLSRFDGVHYGYRSASAKGLEETFKLSRSEGFGSEVKRRIMAGTFVLSHGFYDAYYSKAQKVRRLIKDYTENILQENDLIMLPSTLGTAFEIGKITDPIAMYMQDIFTVHANLTGNPAISIPFAMHSNGLPYGLQFIGKEFEEQNLFQQVSQIA